MGVVGVFGGRGGPARPVSSHSLELSPRTSSPSRSPLPCETSLSPPSLTLVLPSSPGLISSPGLLPGTSYCSSLPMRPCVSSSLCCFSAVAGDPIFDRVMLFLAAGRRQPRIIYDLTAYLNLNQHLQVFHNSQAGAGGIMILDPPISEMCLIDNIPSPYVHVYYMFTLCCLLYTSDAADE